VVGRESLASSAAIGISVMFLLFLASCSSPAEESAARPITPEQLIKGTAIDALKQEVQSAVKSGSGALSLSEALSGSGSYGCIIKTAKGYLGLRIKEGIAREDILWDKQPTVAFIEGAYLYRFSLMHQRWARFDYSPDSETSGNAYTLGIYSHKELRAMPSGNYLCVKKALEDSVFDFPKAEAFDASAKMKEYGLTK